MKKTRLFCALMLSFPLLTGCRSLSEIFGKKKNQEEEQQQNQEEGQKTPAPVYDIPSIPEHKNWSFDEVDPKPHGEVISISTEEQLINFREQVNNDIEQFKNGYVELANDIALTKPWKPIANFSGQFNGNNHTISGLKPESKISKFGLFSSVISAKIGCFTIKGELDVADNSAFVVGYTAGDCLLLGITVNGRLNGNSYLGGVVATVGDGSLKIVGCINAALIQGKGSIGGVLAANKTFKTNISESANYGVVVGSGSTVGGVAASLTNSALKTNDYNLYKCVNYGTVKGNAYVGGVIGLSCCQLINCEVDAKAKTYRILDDGKEEEVNTLTSFEAPYCSALSGSILYKPSINQYGELIECVNRDGFAVTGLNDPAGCTRIIKFKDKILLFSATNRVATSTDGGHTFSQSIQISNKTTEICPIDNEASTDTGNTQPYVLPDGRIAMMYRAHRKASNFSYNSIRMRISDTDGNFNTSDKPIVLIQNYTKITGTPGGFWEPYPILLEDGSFAIYISSDAHYGEKYDQGDVHIKALDPDIIAPGGSQNTVMIPMKVAPGATEVGTDKIEIGEPRLIFKGSDTSMFGHANSRPGMTVLTKLHDGGWAMILEDSTEQHNPGYNMVVQLTYSMDGLTWTAPRTIIRPHHAGGTRNGDGSMYKCCAPFISTLPDGRLFIVCATDEMYEGYYPSDSSHYDQEIAFVTKNRIKYNDDISRDEDLIQVGNYAYSKNEYCVWASCAVIEGQVYVSGLQGVNYIKADGTVGSPQDWMLVSSIYYLDLYSRLGISPIN